MYYCMGLEAMSSYRSWKNGKLTSEEYLKEILKSGGDAGVTSSMTAGLMIPVSKVITLAGASNLLTIPIAFVITDTVNKMLHLVLEEANIEKLFQKLDIIKY